MPSRRRELRDPGVVVDRHDARHDRHVDAERAHLVDEAEVGVGVEEELRDRRVGAGLHLGREVLQVGVGERCLRMVLRVGGDLDRPVAARVSRMNATSSLA